MWVRSAPIAVRVSAGRRARLFALLVAAGDVWAWVLDCNMELRRFGLRPVVNYQRLCAELSDTGVAAFGELGTTGCRSVVPTLEVPAVASPVTPWDQRRQRHPRDREPPSCHVRLASDVG
jgi:hypothetical protein